MYVVLKVRASHIGHSAYILVLAETTIFNVGTIGLFSLAVTFTTALLIDSICRNRLALVLLHVCQLQCTCIYIVLIGTCTILCFM